ncbi:MAG: DUF6599 family protein [bacterium]|nr:hypothetical protein [bacterium]MDT8366947.1 DUF6599 family protein [bacterium]
MRIFPALLLLAVLFCPDIGFAAEPPALPGSFGSNPALAMVAEPKTWSPDNIYEHVNGEAELLKRYGALLLVYASYETEEGAYLSVDILDMGVPVNAFGLYSLYAGCDGDEYSASGATVLSGGFTSYAMLGRYFMRIDFETDGEDSKGELLVGDFLLELSRGLPAPEPLPATVSRLKKLARKPCEVSYHPEHVDYDLEAGPGYTWIGPDGGVCFLHFLPSGSDAEDHAASLRKQDVPTVLILGSAVSWTRAGTQKAAAYLKEVLRKVGER